MILLFALALLCLSWQHNRQILKYKAKIHELANVLCFYTESTNYQTHTYQHVVDENMSPETLTEPSIIDVDRGECARETLIKLVSE